VQHALEGNLVGVFGSSANLKSQFLSSIGKKSETEGIIVYQRIEAGKRFSFLDDTGYPEKIQGYARIASIADYALYLLPEEGGKLSPADGELAVLLDALGVEQGRIIGLDLQSTSSSSVLVSPFKGLKLDSYKVEERSAKSSAIDLSDVSIRKSHPKYNTLVYIDRAFNVKGVGVVVLGFVLSGSISVHDKMRLIPKESQKVAEVKGIQVSDEDYESTGRGIRVGLSLKGIELKDLAKVSWLDDSSFPLASELKFEFTQSKYYKQSTFDRDLHLEVNGELLVGRVSKLDSPSSRTAKLASSVPVWEGMPVALMDLNSKPLRVCGGGVVKL
jgi:selenocysteine-specific translation elongation factor